jgi:hypothetical protein
MQTLTISIPDTDYAQWGIAGSAYAFSDFVELVRKKMMRKNLDECVELAEKYGLSSMTMDEIDEEVRAARHALYS